MKPTPLLVPVIVGLALLVVSFGSLFAATRSLVDVPEAPPLPERVRASDACLGVRPGTPEAWCDVSPYVVPFIRCEDCCPDCGGFPGPYVVEGGPHRQRPEPTSREILLEGLEAIQDEARVVSPAIQLDALDPRSGPTQP